MYMLSFILAYTLLLDPKPTLEYNFIGAIKYVRGLVE